MNDNQFDNLTRTLANGISRRQALKMLGAGIASGLLSFRVPEWVLAQEPPPCGVKTVKIWIKAFIPRDYPGYQPFPGDPSQTMIPDPSRKAGSSNCLLTDQRGFSSDVNAKSRLTSIAVIDVEQARITNGRQGTHYCDQTTGLNCSTGAVTCQKTGKVRGKGFYGLAVSGDRQTITVNLQAATSNPCVGGSPDMGYNGTVRIELLSSGQQVQISFAGFIEPFPAYEMYASVNDGTPQPLFNITSNPNRSVSGTVLLDGTLCPECTVCISGICSPKVCDDPCQECKDGFCQDKHCDDCFACNALTGSCVPVECVNPEETCCGNVCVDTNTDSQHCGRCDRVCGDCTHCENGDCVSTCADCQTCDAATNTCVSTCSACQACQNGTCVDTCGECMHCENGACVSTCSDCQTCQNGTCVDKCGECSHCENGVGVCMPCADTEMCCGGQCINPSQYNCCISSSGSLPCPNGQLCCAGACCQPGWQCCGGQCVPYDRTHCANCFPCSEGQVCCIGPQGQIYGCDDLINCPK